MLRSIIKKIKMEFVKLFILTCCIIVAVNCAEKSELAQQVDALDSLLRAEMFLFNQKIETGQQERELMIEKLNKIMEYIETEDKTEDKTMDGRPHHQDELSEKFDKLWNSFIRIKRGTMEEKVARKNDTKTIVEHLEEMVTNISSLITNQNHLISNQNRLFIAAHGDLVNKVNNLAKTLENALDSNKDEVLESNAGIKAQLTEVMSTTQNLESSIGSIATQVQEVKENVAPTMYCTKELDLNDCAKQHFSKQLPSIIIEVRQLVSLINGNTKYEGIVELIYNGRQGTVCDDAWDDKDAKVVCHMLGFSGGTALHGCYRNSNCHSFGQGTGETLLDEVACSGSEQSIFDCGHRGIGVEDCSHHEDAGVRCRP